MITILTEKPSAAKNFAKALGGPDGTFNGESYEIVNARGHLFELSQPAEQVDSVNQEHYKTWRLDTLPWDPKDFLWTRVKKRGADELLETIQDSISRCSEVAIATDVDPSGEGELLAWEILEYLGWKGRTTRMYFTDESEKSIQKAFITRKSLPSMEQDGDYVKAWARTRFDFLSMQLTRVATLVARERGHGVVVRQGRLKSVMVYMVGKQLDAYNNYKKVPFFEARYQDENGCVYARKNPERFEKAEEVDLTNLLGSEVVLDKTEQKHKPPEKLLDLAGLSSILAGKGYKPAGILDTYQKMYEDHIVSYPRTEDKNVTTEQFNELLPLIDEIADLVGVDPSILTHRTPRRTHVKDEGSHGANRPGSNVPTSLASLKKYGKEGPDIYEILAKNYLAMLAEDYEYETQTGHVKDYPDFIGKVNIPKKPGYKQVFDAEPEEDVSNQGLGTYAESFVYEGANKRPPRPTMKWLTKQLERYNVGTGATRTSTMAEITNEKSNSQLLNEKKGVLTMTDTGNVSYHLLKDTKIADVKVTEDLFSQMEEVGKFQMDPDVILNSVADLTMYDLGVMRKNAETLETGNKAEVATGIFRGEEIRFKREFAGHRFTDEEVEKLLAGENIIITAMSKKTKKEFRAEGHLEKLEYKGKQYFGFNMVNILPAEGEEKIEGVYEPTGENIAFKQSWSGHTFTEGEVSRLLAGEKISFKAKTKKGKEWDVTGCLAKQEYKGREYWGFKLDEQEAPDKVTGVYKPKNTTVSFKRVWGGHTFTDSEIKDLLEGNGIEFRYKKQNGAMGTAKGKLKQQTFKGRKFWGFKLDPK